MRLLARFGLTLVFTALIGSMLWASLGLSRVSGWIPQVVLTATLLLLIGQLALDGRPARQQAAPAEGAVRRRREAAAFVWVGALLLATWLLGVIIGSALFCLAWLRWHGAERWFVCGLFSSVLAITLWAIFARLLAVELFPGVVSQWLS